MRRAAVSFAATILFGGLLAGCAGNATLSADEYRSEVVALCEQPVKDLDNPPPSLHSSPAEVEAWAANQRKAASELRRLDGPAADEKAGRELARRMDETAEELEAIAAAIEAQDDDALTKAMSALLLVRMKAMASCSVFRSGRTPT